MFTDLEMLQSKSMPSCSESTKQLADPREDSECLAMSAPFISFSIARALLLTSCLYVLHMTRWRKVRTGGGGGVCTDGLRRAGTSVATV